MRCNSYDFGQCTAGACALAPWVQDGWGNAGDWAGAAARSGFAETMVPTRGAVVVYAAGDGYSEFGHVGVVMDVYSIASFLVREMNFAAWDQYDDRVSNLSDVAAFILPPGVGAGAGGTGGGGQGGPSSADQVRIEWAGLQQLWNVELPQLRARALRLHDILPQF